VKAKDKVMTYTAARLDAVEYIAHNPNFRGPVSCGGYTPPEHVYVTSKKVNGTVRRALRRRRRGVEVLVEARHVRLDELAHAAFIRRRDDQSGVVPLAHARDHFRVVVGAHVRLFLA